MTVPRPSIEVTHEPEREHTSRRKEQHGEYQQEGMHYGSSCVVFRRAISSSRRRARSAACWSDVVASRSWVMPVKLESNPSKTRPTKRETNSPSVEVG